MTSIPAVPRPQRSHVFAATYLNARFLVDFEYSTNKGLTEEHVKAALTAELEPDGYSVKAGGRLQREPDIEAFSMRNPEIVVEAKGEGRDPKCFAIFSSQRSGKFSHR
jgi:hypothetical protein